MGQQARRRGWPMIDDDAMIFSVGGGGDHHGDHRGPRRRRRSQAASSSSARPLLSSAIMPLHDVSSESYAGGRRRSRALPPSHSPVPHTGNRAQHRGSKRLQLRLYHTCLPDLMVTDKTVRQWRALLEAAEWCEERVTLWASIENG